MLARVDALARRWAIALIVERPLDAIGEVPVEDLAREAPSLCRQVIRALESDVELIRLTGDASSSRDDGAAEARRLAAICGARDAAAAVAAAEALRGVLWEALLDELQEPSARLLADVGDRLAYVCASALAAALEVPAACRAGAAAHADSADVVVADGDSAARGPARRSAAGREPLPASAHASGAVIVDERVAAGRAPVPVLEMEQEPEQARAPSWEASRPLGEAPSAQIEIRDERRDEGPAAWIGSIGAQLERFERDRLPFAVLLVELAELERLRREQPPEELARLAGRVERALTDALGARSGALTRERPGRCWLLAAETDRAGVELLAERVARAVASQASLSGASLSVAIGTAVCPEDGRQAASLAAHADVGLYAARSALRASVLRSPASVDESA